ncbi:transporter substrate-binding domain-containing protein [Aliamphritea ceti]|uniref:transporter substrate-binding domain-containing protein n=1 Tax=Aliamphritea ceti TaxID=1524258 RepID=UPI0021C3545E|nr:transporter substrate-binding domain-containing protein [Aliamphritea ceti]
MKFCKSILSGLAVATVALTVSSANAGDKLRLGTEGAFPPFNYIDSAGKLAGFDVDIGEELCKRIEQECELVAQDYDGLIPGLLAEKYDFLVASLFITEARKKQVSFSDPYYLAAMTHVTDKKSGITEFNNEALSGKVIGAQSGTTQADFIGKIYPDADIRLYSTQDEVNLDMASGRLDVMVGDVIPLQEWTQKTDDGACCTISGEPITNPEFVGEGVGIAVRKQDEELLKALNKALAEILADGTYKKINDKYFDLNVYTMKVE